MEFKIIKKQKAPVEKKEKGYFLTKDHLFGLENNFLIRLNKAKKELNESIRNINSQLQEGLEKGVSENGELLGNLAKELAVFEKEIQNIKHESKEVDNELYGKIDLNQSEVKKLADTVEGYREDSEELSGLLKQLTQNNSETTEESGGFDKLKELFEKIKAVETGSINSEKALREEIEKEKKGFFEYLSQQLKNVEEVELKNYRSLARIVEDKNEEQRKFIKDEVAGTNENLNAGVKNAYKNILAYYEKTKEDLAKQGEKFFFEVNVLKKAVEISVKESKQISDSFDVKNNNLKKEINKCESELFEKIQKLVVESRNSSNERTDKITGKIKKDLTEDFERLKSGVSSSVSSLNEELCSKIEKSNKAVDDKIEKASRKLFEDITKEIDKKKLYEGNKEISFLKDEIAKITKEVVERDSALREVVEKYDIKIDEKDIEAVIRKNPKLLKKIPDHLYKDGFLQFEKPDGSWGPKIKLFNNIQRIYESIGGGGGNGFGGGEVSIYDEGNSVNEKVRSINFIGSSVVAVQDENDSERVNVYIPPPNYSSRFNTTDGNTNATVADCLTTLRFVSNPQGQFDIGDWVPGTKHPCVKKNALVTFATVDSFSIFNRTATLKISVLNYDKTRVIKSEVLLLDEEKNVNKTWLNAQISNFKQEALKYSALFSCNINLEGVILEGGRVVVELEYSHPQDLMQKKSQEFFYDGELNPVSVGSLEISESDKVTRFLSGVEYYTTGSQFNVTAKNVAGFNDKTFDSQQLEMDCTSIGCAQFGVLNSEISGWSNKWDLEAFDFTKKTPISLSNIFLCENRSVKCRGLDWSNTTWLNSNSLAMLVDTGLANETRIYEDFRNENRRLKEDLTTPWSSQESLVSGNGAQQKGSKLIYPRMNFKLFLPNSTTQPDYSNLTGPKTYYRKMWHTTTTFSNGLINLTGTGLTELNFGDSKNFNIEFSINKIDWFRLDKDYEGGVLLPGSGARVNKDTTNLNAGAIAFTLGENLFSMEIYFKIVLNNSNVEIDSINLNWV